MFKKKLARVTWCKTRAKKGVKTHLSLINQKTTVANTLFLIITGIILI